VTDAPPDVQPDDLDTTDPDAVDTEQDTDTEEEEAWTPPSREEWERLSNKAKRRDEKLREAQAELARLRAKDKGEDDDSEPDPAERYRNGLVRTAARATLATVAGVTDRDDQARVLEVLNLSGVEVDDEGDVDTAALEEALTDLRRILGVPAQRTSRPRLDPRDKGGSDTKVDSDSRRYRDFITKGRTR
jgi:hypothetical protein